MRSVLLLLFAVFLFAVMTTPPQSQDQVGGACAIRHIIVLNRSTRLDPESEALLYAGLDSLFGADNLDGAVDALEVRDSAYNYRSLSEFLVEPISPAPPEFQRGDCPRAANAAFETPSETQLREQCEQEQLDLKEEIDAARREHLASLERRDEQREDIKASIAAALSADDPTATRTAIIGSLPEILRARCGESPCHLYIFSDLIDAEIRQPINDQGRTASDLRDLAEVELSERSSDQPASEYGLRVFAWGVGRSERSGAPLAEDVQIRLTAFWDEYFSILGDRRAYLGLEFPSERQIMRSIERSCGQ